MKRALIATVLFCLMVTSSVQAARAPYNKALNNLVSELANTREQGTGAEKNVEFTNPRQGWCYFVVAGKATVRLNSETDPLMAADGVGKSAEAMRNLPAGLHTLRIEGTPDDLIVRAVPALQYAYYGSGEAWALSHGPYDWEFLGKDVLPNINVMISVGKVNPAHLGSWKGSGRSWISLANVPGSGKEDVTADEAYDFWAGNIGLTDPLMDGIMVDEFPGGDQPKYDAYRLAVERIYANPAFKGKTFSPYSCGGGGILSGYTGKDRCEEFARACMKGGGDVCIERYLVEQPTADAADAFMRNELLVGWNMPRFGQDFPGVAKRSVMVLGYMSAVGESLNINPAVDFKVFMDMQMRLLATDPAYAGLGGIQQYHSGYADEETIRWAGRLYRHYAIEGKKNLLSDELGYKYNPGLIRNPDFTEGVSGWTLQPAEPESIIPGRHPKYGFLQFRGFYADGTGDHFLKTKRSAKAPNRFSQEIVNLTPGKLYSMKMVSGDYQDLVQQRDDKKLHAVSIDLENVELMPGEKQSFQYVFPTHYARPVDEFKGNHSYWMNYHWRIFRATGTTARLTVSDWKSANDPGGPAGQELIFNFIEVQPYYPH